MEKLLSPTFLNGRYRLDRLVVAHDDVTIWKATDVARGISVQLSIFERGSTLLQQGKTEEGMFLAIDSSPRSVLELVDESEALPPARRIVSEPREPRRRAWPWAAAGLACALTALGGWYVAAGRAHPIGETTITAAEIPAPPPLVTSQPPVIERTPAAPIVVAPPPAVTTPPAAVKTPVAVPRHDPPRAKPLLPKPVTPRPQSPPVSSFDPLTI